MNTVYLSIGTNIGEREGNLVEAVRQLVATENIHVQKVSSIYETAPVGYVDQQSFLNIAVVLETTLQAFEMLNVCQAIEQQLGRVRLIRWGPRSIDLDILLFNHENIETESLIVPHERMYERAFVLVPLAEISEPNTEQLLQVHKKLSQMDIEKEGVMLWKQVKSVEEFVRFEN
jgi:2-amino-4-hydroxy-6-hydroxymethyldihydropteridine diphosphokinase